MIKRLQFGDRVRLKRREELLVRGDLVVRCVHPQQSREEYIGRLLAGQVRYVETESLGSIPLSECPEVLDSIGYITKIEDFLNPDEKKVEGLFLYTVLFPLDDEVMASQVFGSKFLEEAVQCESCGSWEAEHDEDPYLSEILETPNQTRLCGPCYEVCLESI